MHSVEKQPIRLSAENIEAIVEATDENARVACRRVVETTERTDA